MLRFIWTALLLLGLTAYVLYDSKALEFQDKRVPTANDTELVYREKATPVFHWDRLKVYFNNLVSKISK